MVKALLSTLGVIGLMVAGGLVASGSAQAHAVLVESAPAVKAEVSARQVDINLHYNSRIDAKRSRLVLKGGAKDIPLDVRQGRTEADIGAQAKDIKPGRYVLHWDVLSVDGHVSRGQIPFTAVER